MTKKLSRVLIPLFGILLFAVMLWVLHEELSAHSFRDIQRRVQATHWQQLGLALGLTLLAYAVLPAYDFLGLRYVGRKVAAGRVALISLLSFVFSNNVGFLGLSGAAVRLRHYTARGLSPGEVVKLSAFTTASFWLGLFTVAGMMFVVNPLPLPALPAAMAPYVTLPSMRPLGAVFVVLAAAYVLTCTFRKAPLRLWKWRFALPSFRLAIGQLAIGSVDWLLAAAALYVLMPEVRGHGHALTFSGFFTMFLLAQVVALISHVPGGLGVFETVMVLMLNSKTVGMRPDVAFGALVVYRVVYYLLPLIVGSLAMGGYELVVHRRRVQLLLHLLVPDVLAFLSFVGGIVLLFSGATPALRQLWWMGVLVPLPLVEVSPFAASLAGIMLILLARGLQRRFDGAYYLTVGLMGAGIVASLYRGWDYEEACVLAVFLAALLPCRREFYRHASLFSDRFTLTWISGVSIVLVAMLLLTVFAYRDQKDLRVTWWQLELSTSAPPLARAGVAVCVLGLMIVGRQLLQPAKQRRHSAPDEAEVARAGALAERSPSTYAYLALLADKSLLFSDRDTGFLMYSVSGGSWITMGDPVGPAEAVGELARRFHERCDRAGAQTVFYQVYPANLHVYVDMGLSLIKIGEEGRVPLKGFSLVGRARKNLRHMLNKAHDAGYSFRMVPAAEVAALMPELRAISDAWLTARKLGEKGFSLGFFDEAYLARFPIALVEQNGKVVAFANLWPGAGRAELSIDLMRHLPDSSNGVMDILFIELMLWGAAEGYQWFNLGMAPLSGLNNSLLAPLWSRFGEMIFHHGENFYNFQGLRRFKEKFDPIWESRYLASPGGLALPRILAEVTTLIQRGSKGRKEVKGAAPVGAAAGAGAPPAGPAEVLPNGPTPRFEGSAV